MSASDDQTDAHSLGMSSNEDKEDCLADGVYLIFKKVPTTFFQRLFPFLDSSGLEDPFLICVENGAYSISDWQGKSSSPIEDFEEYLLIPISDDQAIYQAHIRISRRNRLGFKTEVESGVYESPSAYFWHFIKLYLPWMDSPRAHTSAKGLYLHLGFLLRNKVN